MPNHITNILRVSAYSFNKAPAGLVDAVLAAIKSDDCPFDFNRLIPMPPELDIESGGKTSSALALHDDEKAQYELGLYQRRNPELRSIADLRAHLRKTMPDIDDFAAKVRSNLDKYGATDWYHWRPEHWGTKWNAYSVVTGKTDGTTAFIHFETAWAPPLPVLDKLASMFRLADFRLIWCDEGDSVTNRVYWSAGKRETDDDGATSVECKP